MDWIRISKVGEMSNLKRVIFIVLILFVLFTCVLKRNALSWDQSTHMKLSKYAADNSVLRNCIDETDMNCDYLKSIGFDKGLEEELKWDVVRKTAKWFEEGANLEDAADIPLDLLENKGRFNNHFHNPLAPWYDQEWKDLDVFDAGLDDEVYMPISYLSTFPVMTPILLLDPLLSQFPDYNNEILHIYGISSLLWAQDGSYQFNLDEDEGDWSWQKIRELYYSALISTTDALRQENFAKVFRGLGHQIHLVQDAAQPDHVRNDGHPWDSLGFVNLFRKKGGGFEKWLKDNNQFLRCLLEDHTLPNCTGFRINATVNIDDYLPQVPLDPSQLSVDPQYFIRGLTPSAFFIDANKYDGTNPSSSFVQGISEYTNTNFFSDDTIFASERFATNHRYYFPYPRKGSTNIQSYFDGVDLTKTVTARDGILDTRIWISKVGDGENIEFFVTMDYLSRAYYTVLGEGPTYYKSLYRDEEAHKDYASLLIPRAVGYSAGLLDYFFRGDIEPVSLAVIVNTNNEITSIRMRIRNNTPNESLEPLISPEESKFIISFQYKLPGDSNTHYVLSDEVVLNEIIASGGESTGEFIFTITQGQEIPSNAQDVKFYVVYRGKLGNEDDAVIGRYNYLDNLAITAPDEFIYSIIEGGNTPYTDSYGNQHQQFISMQANVNITELNGTIESGNIQAVAKYKMRTDYQPDLTNDPPMAGSRESDYSYSTSSPAGLISGDITALNALEVREFTFDFSGDPIPAGITDLYLEITIIGKVVGDTEDIIIATGTTDLNEPQHFSIWNATDWFYLDGVLRTADEIINTPALLARVDFDGDGIVSEPGEPYIDPYEVNTEVAFYPTTETPTLYNAAYTPLPPGRFGNIIILTDMPDFYIRIHRQSTIPSVDWTSDILYSGVTNQENNGTFESTQVITFRGIIQHQWAAYVSYYPDAVGISTAPWPVPAITDPYPADTLSP